MIKPVLFAFTLAATPILGAQIQSAEAAEALEDALARGELLVGIASENFVPWLADDKDGGRMGYEIDVANGIAQSLNLELTFVEVPFNELIPQLTTGEVDVVISAVSVTASRAVDVFFSHPYGETDYTLVMDSEGLSETAADNGFDEDGLKIGVGEGSVAQAIAAGEFTKAELVPLTSSDALRDEFVAGNINGAIVPTPYPAFIVAQDPSRFVVEDQPITSTRQAMVTRLDSPRLLNVLNAWVIEHEANGSLEAMHSYWFESGDWVDMLKPETTVESAPEADTKSE